MGFLRAEGSVGGVYSQMTNNNSLHIGSFEDNRNMRPEVMGTSYLYQRRGRRGFGNMSKVTCQLCGKLGHVVLQCYHRFGITYLGHSSAK